MRYVIYILAFTLISASLKAQLPSNTFISRNFTGNTKAQWILLDSPVVNPILDTFYARYPGTQIVRIQGGDTSFWFYGGNRRWFRALQAPDTVSLSNRINLKLNINDTAAMLSPYLRKIDTTNIWVTSVFRKTASDSVFYVKGGNNVFAFNDSIGGGGSGTVTSVALSMPSAFTVTGSPITTSGTFNVSGAGTSLEYIRGNGTLATFDTTAIPNFYIKARSLLSGTSPITYNSTTGAIGINNATASGTKGAATFVNSSFSDNGLGTIDLLNITSAGTCINCDITFDAKGRAVSYASGTPPNFVNAPGAGDTLSFLDTLKRLNAGFGILHTVTNYNITQKVDTSVIATPYDLTQLSFPNSNIGSGYRWAVPNTNNIKTVFASNTILWDSTSNSNGLTPKADTSVLATQYDLTAKQDTMLTDVYRLPQIKQNYPAQGIANSGVTVTNYPISALDSSIYYLTTTSPFISGTKFGGVLWSTPIGDSAQISAPFGVLAGSSFDEGHRLLHGRLHPNGIGVFDYAYPDSAGQMSYHLRQLTNYRWYNHGIGGQTSSQLRFRWCRDVLAQTCDPNDGRGTKTLSRVPWIVIFDGCGNDPYGVGMTPAISIANLEYFAKSCQDNNIRFIVCNSPSGPPASVTVAGVKYLETINKFLESGGLDKYGAIVFDLKSYWSDPAFGYDGLHGNPNLIDPVDGVHFTKAGYDSLSNAIFNTCKIPVLTKVAFINKLAPTNPLTNYAYADSLTISGVPYKLTKQSDTLNITSPLVTDSIWITAKNITTVVGAGTQYGYSHIDWVLDNNVANDSFYTRKTMGSNGASSNNPDISTLTITPQMHTSNEEIFDIKNATNTGYAWRYLSAGYPKLIINSNANSIASITALMTLFPDGVPGSVVISSTGNANITGTSSQIGVLQLQQNGTPTTTGFGISEANTLSSIALYGTAQKNKDLIRLTTWNGANAGLGATAHTNILSIANTGFSNPDGSNQVGNALSITPQINDTSTLNTSIQIRGIYYNPIKTSLTNVRHFGIWLGSGNNYFNVKGDSTCFGCDSTTFVNARFRVNGSVRLDSVVVPSGSYTVLVHDVDSIVKQVPSSSLFTFNNGLTNTSGTVQLGGSLIQATNIAVGNNSLGIVAANSTISTNRITIDNTNALMSGRYEDFSSINNIYVNQDNIQIISTQPIGARRILLDSITGIQIGENISGTYKGIIVKKTTSQLQFNAYGNETFTGAPTKLLAETSTGDIIEVGGRNLQSGTTYTVLSTDVYKIIGLSNSAARTITLPAASAFPSGVTVWFKDEAGTAGTGNITINRAGSDTIDGATSYTISSNYGFIGLYSNGSNAWFVR